MQGNLTWWSHLLRSVSLSLEISCSIRSITTSFALFRHIQLRLNSILFQLFINFIWLSSALILKNTAHFGESSLYRTLFVGTFSWVYLSFSWSWSCLSWVKVHSALEDFLGLLFVSIWLKVRFKASIIQIKGLRLRTWNIFGKTLNGQVIIGIDIFWLR